MLKSGISTMSKLKPVDFRMVWNHEAYNFIRWLSENKKTRGFA